MTSNKPIRIFCWFVQPTCGLSPTYLRLALTSVYTHLLSSAKSSDYCLCGWTRAGAGTPGRPQHLAVCGLPSLGRWLLTTGVHLQSTMEFTIMEIPRHFSPPAPPVSASSSMCNRVVKSIKVCFSFCIIKHILC